MIARPGRRKNLATPLLPLRVTFYTNPVRTVSVSNLRILA